MKQRPCSRVLLIDDQNRILLFKYEDDQVINLAHPGSGVFWITPGGGLEPGESHEAAALRELREETGITGAVLGPWLWTREVDLLWQGVPTHAHERFYLVRIGSAEVDCSGFTHDERRVYRAHRWWTVEELCRSDERITPQGLGEMLGPVLAGRLPESPILIA